MYLSNDSSGFDAVTPRSKAYQSSYARTAARLRGKSAGYSLAYGRAYSAAYKNAMVPTRNRMFRDTLPAAAASIAMQEGAIPYAPNAAFTSEYAPQGTDAFSPVDDLAPSMRRAHPVVAVRNGRVVGLQDANGDMIEDARRVASQPSFFQRFKMPIIIGLGALGAMMLMRKKGR